MPLQNVHVGRRAAPRRTLVYGPPGTGKSTFASKSKKPIFIPTEEGVNDIECTSFPKAQSFADVMSYIEQLYKEEHDYETVVTDSLDWLESLINVEVCQKRKVETIGDIGFGKAPTFTLPFWQEFLSGMEALRDVRKMNILFVAHSQIEKVNPPDTDQYDRYSPRLDKLASAIVQEWCDDVLFVNFKVYTKQTDVGFNQKRTQGIGSGERIIRTTERPSQKAKNHLGLPDEIPLDWNVYAEYLPPIS